MRLALIFFLIVLFNAQSQDLKDYLWRNRVVLIFADSNVSNLPKKQTALFKAQLKDMAERDMILLPAKSALKTQLHLDENFQGVVLIGKDGGVKFKGDFVIDPKKLFSLIDGMPMRQAEMRRKKG